MPGLRIAMLTTFYPPYSFGGDAVGIQRLARALVRIGHDVTVIHDEDAFLTLGGKVAEAAPTEDDPKRVGLRSQAGIVSNFLTQQLGRPVVHGSKITETLERGDFDIVWHNNNSLVGGPGLFGVGGGLQVYEAHEHWLVCPMHVLWRYNRELCDQQKCLSCTLSFKRPPQWWRWTGFMERQAENIDLFIAKSVFSKKKHAEFGFKPEMQVVPYFLPDIEPSEEKAAHDRPYFLFVGRLEKIKGLQDVIPIFETYEGADLVICGDGEYREELERLAAGNPRVIFKGRMGLDALNAWYRGALGLIVPSVCYETFGIILIESFRLGTPVIARDLGPFPEIVTRSGGGRLFKTDDELLDAMEALRSDPAVRNGQAEAARAAFDEIWSEGSVLAAYGRVLAEAAKKAGKTDLARRLENGAFETGDRDAVARQAG